MDEDKERIIVADNGVNPMPKGLCEHEDKPYEITASSEETPLPEQDVVDDLAEEGVTYYVDATRRDLDKAIGRLDRIEKDLAYDEGEIKDLRGLTYDHHRRIKKAEDSISTAYGLAKEDQDLLFELDGTIKRVKALMWATTVLALASCAACIVAVIL